MIVGSAAEPRLCDQSVEALDEIGHCRDDGELANPLPHAVEIGFRMGVEERLEIDEVTRALGHCLHDHEVLDARQPDVERAQRMRLARRDSIALEREAAERDVDVDLRRTVRQQQYTCSSCESNASGIRGSMPEASTAVRISCQRASGKSTRMSTSRVSLGLPSSGARQDSCRLSHAA